MKKVAFYTLGCKVNQYETEAITEMFINKGYEIVDFSGYSDIYIINTCTVTNIADKKSRQILSKAKKNNEKAIIVAVGCYVQVAKDELMKDTNIDMIIGNNNKMSILECVETYINDKKEKNHVLELSEQKEYEDLYVSKVHDKTRVFIKIQDGCNQFCSYCIIPYTRGRIRSRDSLSIIKEVREIVANGYQEIVLTGIHLASYEDKIKEYHLIDLLEELDSIEHLTRIRLGSLEPNLINDEFVGKLGKLKKICPHFHLSLQSGCDETLKRMNRNYTTKKYKNSVELLRRAFNEPAITTDIIVGFPMESEEEFNSTKEFVKAIGFSDIHVFKYSKRKGTKAALMEGQIEERIKSKRSKELITIKEELFDMYCKKFVGKKVEVLIENLQHINGNEYMVGHTNNYMRVAIPVNKNYLTNEFATIKIEVYNEGILYA